MTTIRAASLLMFPAINVSQTIDDSFGSDFLERVFMLDSTMLLLVEHSSRIYREIERLLIRMLSVL